MKKIKVMQNQTLKRKFDRANGNVRGGTREFSDGIRREIINAGNIYDQ